MTEIRDEFNRLAEVMARNPHVVAITSHLEAGDAGPLYITVSREPLEHPGPDDDDGADAIHVRDEDRRPSSEAPKPEQP
jgi:hypothetical protein